MKKLILLFGIAFFYWGCTTKSEKESNENIITEKEVKDFVNGYDNMWAKRDTTAMKEAMAENYIYFTSTGNTSTRDRIISWFTPADKYTVDTAMRSEITIAINGNAAIVSSRWIGAGSFDGERFRDDQRCSLTIQKEKGKLKLISEHCTQIVNQH